MENKFCENLKRLRQEEKLTQTQLAEKIGSTQRKISFLEKGVVEPDLSTLISLSKFFKVSTDDLLGIEP